MAAVYLLVVAAIAGVLAVGEPEPPAVSVLGPAPGAGGGTGGTADHPEEDPESPAGRYAGGLLSALARRDPAALRALLRLTIPMMALADEVGPVRIPDLDAGTLLLGFAAQHVIGIRPGDPGTLLSAGFAVLHEVPRPPATVAGAHGPGERAGSATGGTGGAGDGAAEGADSEDPLVLIYHTHAREAYLPELFPARAVASGGVLPAGLAFSEDGELGVLAIGEELVRALQAEGIPALHLREPFDRDGRGAAYTRALPVLRDTMAARRGLQVVIDLHRDAVRRDGTTARVDGKDVAQLLFVMGSNRNFDHPGWRDNLAFAQALAERVAARFPALLRREGILVKNDRYNQHLHPRAVLVEVGGVDNSLEEARRAVRLLAQVLAAMIREGALDALPAGARAP